MGTDGRRSRLHAGGLRAAAGLGALLLLGAPAAAQVPAEMFKGRTVDLYVGYSAGGGYDVYGRLVARHIGRHLPGNPTVIARNMEGAGSIRLANWLQNVAPRDGTAFGIVSRGAAFDPLLGAPGAYGPKRPAWGQWDVALRSPGWPGE
jgi:tripartite-type tricarboxylate transporter receptor subunit TctC